MNKGKWTIAMLACLGLGMATISGCGRGTHEQVTETAPTTPPAAAKLAQPSTPSTPTPGVAQEEEVQGVVCNRFRLKHELRGGSLSMWLETDLPDSTEVMMGVYRCYYEKGSSSAYPIDYFSEKSTVGKWRTPRALSLDDAKWRAKLDERQRILARAGAAIEIIRIDDDVELGATVPINQSDPRFGERNANLTGKAVPTSGLRAIRSEIDLNIPMPSASAAAAKRMPVWGDPRNLHVARSYRLSKETPLMPEFHPADPIEALGRIKQISSGGAIRVLSKRDRHGTPWYQVKAWQANGTQLGTGWINSVALVGQDLKLIKQ